MTYLATSLKLAKFSVTERTACFLISNAHTRSSQIPGVSLNHDGTDGSDGTGIQSVSPVPSASVAGPSVPSVVIAAVIN